MKPTTAMAIRTIKAMENQPQQVKETNWKSRVWSQGDRAIAFASGGAFLCGIIAELPGAIVGAIVGLLWGYFTKTKPENKS